MDDSMTVHEQIVSPIRSRFERLRSVLSLWQQRAEIWKQQVPDAFANDDLVHIQHLMQEYHQLMKQINELKQFLSKWEAKSS
jgi:thiamine kinase-like enzyme